MGIGNPGFPCPKFILQKQTPDRIKKLFFPILSPPIPHAKHALEVHQSPPLREFESTFEWPMVMGQQIESKPRVYHIRRASPKSLLMGSTCTVAGGTRLK